MSTHFPNLANTPAVAPPSNDGTPPQGPQIWQYAHLIRRPDDPIVNQRFEFVGLSQKVREHLVNQIGVATRDGAARILFVQGRPGEGKSEGCLVACLKAGFHCIVLSPGLFAGAEEGKPIERLHALMEELVSYSLMHRCRVVVIIDDFDLSIANVDNNTTHTVHSQLIVNEFMSLADKRHLYRNADSSNIGFILTINDGTGLRESLTRSGRALIYDHVPSFEDKANIAFAILDPKTTAERVLVQQLVNKFAKRQPVSFWKALYFQMLTLHAHRLTSNGMPAKADIDRAQGQRLPLVDDIAWEAARIVRQARIVNHLKTRSWWRW